MRRLRALLALPLLLAGCGDLPEPFKDNPGATALRLAAPPPARLAVPVPAASMLSNEGASLWARDMAGSLDDQSVPAEAHAARPGDWRLVLAASLAGDTVIPTYTVLTPTGQVRGALRGTPVPATEWADADPKALAATATAEAPEVADLLTGIQASIRQADPHSLMHRPAKLFLSGVTGASGTGDAELATALHHQLAFHGDVFADGPRGADYTVAATVGIASPKDDQQVVEIDWHVLDAGGHDAGNVTQLNAVPAHSLDAGWGEIADAAATEAANGIQQVIDRNAGRDDKPVPPPKA